jgi:CheY-like chemotaxis protein
MAPFAPPRGHFSIPKKSFPFLMLPEGLCHSGFTSLRFNARNSSDVGWILSGRRISNETAQRAHAMAQASGVERRRCRIAVVDDDRNIVLLLAYNLQSAGHEVSVIVSGNSAVDELARANPDLVILDWELPGLSGIEVLRQLRERLAPRRIPVIMLTGRSDRDDKRRAIGTGADIFLSKPFAISELMHHVDALLEREFVPVGDSPLPDTPKPFVCHH